MGPRSTGQLATGQPTLFVMLMGRSYPSTSETVGGVLITVLSFLSQKVILAIIIIEVSVTLKREFCDSRGRDAPSSKLSDLLVFGAININHRERTVPV